MNTYQNLAMMAVLGFAAVSFQGCETDEENNLLIVNDSTRSTATYETGCQSTFDSLPFESPSQIESEALVWMREEEFLARDVFLALYKFWNIAIFNNISKSEQQHTDAVKKLLDKYGLEDLAANHQPGVFLHSDLQTLYDELLAKGSLSSTEALRVGATIEDLDIADLTELAAEVDNADILWVFRNLTKGSRNHLRSFVGQLQSRGVGYTPQFITPDLFESIIHSPHETGCVGN